MKRHRSDTDYSRVKAMAAAQLPTLRPPAYVSLRDGDQPFWDGIVKARARDTWNEADLVAAAQLARCRADIERLQKEIDAQGDVIDNQRGTPVMNPRHSLLEVLSRRSLALAKALHVHAEATVGRPRDTAQQSAAEREASVVVETIDDVLIPRLHAA